MGGKIKSAFPSSGLPFRETGDYCIFRVRVDTLNVGGTGVEITWY